MWSFLFSTFPPLLLVFSQLPEGPVFAKQMPKHEVKSVPSSQLLKQEIPGSSPNACKPELPPHLPVQPCLVPAASLADGSGTPSPRIPHQEGHSSATLLQ